MTSRERTDRTALRNGDASLRHPVAGVTTSEDIRLIAREESWLTTNIERVIRSGHPSDREILRSKAIERIKQYKGSQALNHLLPLYENILMRVDAAIIADAREHQEYLMFCIERDKRTLERAQQSNNPFLRIAPIEASIERCSARIAEIAIQRLSEPRLNGSVSESSDSRARGEAEELTPAAMPLALCPA